MGNLIISVDFDGTIVEHDFPRIGKPLPDAFETLKYLKEQGHKLILFTCRENNLNKGMLYFVPHKQYLTEAIQFCHQNGVVFDAVNEAIDDLDFRDPEEYKRRKPYADIYIDDRNFGTTVNWKQIRLFFTPTE